jgi:hypothetical protein
VRNRERGAALEHAPDGALDEQVRLQKQATHAAGSSELMTTVLFSLWQRRLNYTNTLRQLRSCCAI